ncbi:MAG: NAD(P)/FAD-dependent oxidoreductase [Moorella humiferrea]|nr:NAD(P)/FAD-dependent oxidoreductase [Moorella humiferrea]
MAHYVIIGNSAAGIAAAEAIRSVTLNGDVTIVSDEPVHPYSRCLITEAIAKDSPVEEISFRPADFYHRLNIQPLLGNIVDAIHPAEHKIRLDNGKELPYTALLVATGARAVRAKVPGQELDGVFTLRTWSDAQRIARKAQNAEHAVVIGGGLVSLKAAAALKKRGVPRITVVVKSGRLLSRQLDERGAALIQQALAAEGIEFVWGQNPKAFKNKPGSSRIEAVLLEDGREIKAGLVIVGKGVIPNVELIKEAGGRVRQGAIVNNFQQTSLPGVYAAGDVAETVDLLTGERVPSGLWTLAVEQGKIAGFNMAGERCPYEGNLTRLNAAEFAGVPFVSVGLVEKEGAGWKHVSYFNSHKNSYRRLVFREKRLVGAILVGDISQAGIYTALIRRGIEVSGREEELLYGEVSAYQFMGLAKLDRNLAGLEVGHSTLGRGK